MSPAGVGLPVTEKSESHPVPMCLKDCVVCIIIRIKIVAKLLRRRTAERRTPGSITGNFLRTSSP